MDDDPAPRDEAEEGGDASEVIEKRPDTSDQSSPREAGTGRITSLPNVSAMVRNSRTGE